MLLFQTLGCGWLCGSSLQADIMGSPREGTLSLHPTGNSTASSNVTPPSYHRAPKPPLPGVVDSCVLCQAPGQSRED